jgi:hypothetical protein
MNTHRSAPASEGGEAVEPPCHVGNVLSDSILPIPREKLLPLVFSYLSNLRKMKEFRKNSFEKISSSIMACISQNKYSLCL